mmetsp:Transcript_4284/g.8201  ORF Transcript_4284/g.8201 Transcript_4284/m.8201 type:complete len:82 (+) Transcript_4284:1800-2045(+)
MEFILVLIVGQGGKSAFVGNKSIVPLKKVMSTPKLGELFCYFPHGYEMLNTCVTKINVEIKNHMTVQNSKCSRVRHYPWRI